MSTHDGDERCLLEDWQARQSVSVNVWQSAILLSTALMPRRRLHGVILFGVVYFALGNGISTALWLSLFGDYAFSMVAPALYLPMIAMTAIGALRGLLRQLP